MRPLRFCHFTTFYPPYNFGGDGIGVQRLSRALARRGHDVTVVHDADAYNMLHKGAEPTPEPDPDGVKTIAMKSGMGSLSCLLTQQLGRPVINRGKFESMLREGEFDVINYHNVSLVGGPGLLSIGDATKLYMAHEHWLVCPSHVLWRHNRERCDGKECLRCVLNHGRPPQLWRATNAIARHGRSVDAFIAMSEFSRAKHAEFGFPFEMQVLPYFLPDPEPGAQRPVRNPATSPHPRPYFLFVGRLEKIKGLQDVIPLFGEYDGADLVIAGSGDYADELKQLGAGLERVKFLGRVSEEDLHAYYRHAEALIVPSICFETFGIILIEAFTNGIPVIARRLGPFPEIVEAAGAGELFETDAELVAAMQRIRTDPEHRERLAENGYRAYLERWSESAVIPQYLDIVRRAAESRGDQSVLDALGPA